jgi:hypothetical protein
MEHSDKVRHLEEARQQRRLGGMVIYPVANQQGCAMAPFEFVQAAERPAGWNARNEPPAFPLTRAS